VVQADRSERRTGRWLVEFRRRYLSEHPLCARCEAKGRVKLATQLDHRIAMANGGKDFDEDPGNAQGLCEGCHVDKTAEDLCQIKRIARHESWG